jgi:hypothetical protein
MWTILTAKKRSGHRGEWRGFRRQTSHWAPQWRNGSKSINYKDSDSSLSDIEVSKLKKIGKPPLKIPIVAKETSNEIKAFKAEQAPRRLLSH